MENVILCVVSEAERDKDEHVRRMLMLLGDELLRRLAFHRYCL